MKKIILFLMMFPLFFLAQGQPTNPWLRSGNTLINNLSYLGTDNNTSLLFKTNNLQRFKIDSTGVFRFNGSVVNFGSGGNVLYTSSGVPSTRSITINGIGYDLSADRTYTTNFNPTNLKTTSYTLTPFDFVPVDLTAGSLTITLPANPTDRTYACVKLITAASPNVLTIKTGTSTNTFNRTGGVTSFTVAAQNQGYQLLYSSLTGVWYITADDLPSTYLDTKYWGLLGNATGSNSNFIGTTDNRSFKMRAYSSGMKAYLQIDSLGALRFKDTTSNLVNPNAFTLRKYPGDPSYQVAYFGAATERNTNYNFIYDSTGLFKINAGKTFILSQGSANMLSIMGSQVNGIDGAAMAASGLYNFLSCAGTTTAALNNCIPMMKSGSLTYSLSGTTVPILQWWQIQAPNIKSSTPTTVTDFYWWRLQNPTFDAGITITNNWGLRNDGNSTTGGSSYLGGQVVASPTAIVTMAAGNTTRTAVQMTNQNAPTSPIAGSFWYGTTLGFQYTGNMWASGNGTTVGTYSVGSTLTAGAGLKAVGVSSLTGVTNTGSISTTTQFSCGTTFTSTGIATMNGILNTGSISTTTQFSCGTTFTSTGAAKLTGGIIGTATNDNATAGNVGEIVTSLVAVGSAVGLTTATAANVTSISLTAGDWDVSANLNFNEVSSTVSARTAGISSTSATLPSDGSEGYCGVQSTVTSEINTITLSRKRFSLSGTTTVYLVAKATFAAGTCSGFGTITARRIR